MKLAISNIAWPREHDPRAADLLVEHGFRGVEIAPTRVWDRPLEAREDDAREHRRFWNERGIEVVALQALLFGRPGLTLFGAESARAVTLEHLRGLMRLAEWLGARVLVFGAPRNRQLSGRSPDEARAIAVDFFRSAGESALEHGVVLAIEPNPPQYGCDFVTTSSEGLSLVREVASPGFGLHLDAAAMTMGGEDPDRAIREAAGGIAHFHASEPFLGGVGRGGVNHRTCACALREIDYPHWVSIEMRDPGTALVEALIYALEVYGSASKI